MNYYNEFDPIAAERLRLLMDAGLIPQGVVDTRSIVDVRPEDLRGFIQCHFFAGIAGWPLALQLAGIPDTFPLWTGSPPCQPFSVAGKGDGTKDSRHLAPAFLDLIAECRPPGVCGEQVGAAVKKDWWLDALLFELEAQGYTCSAHVLPAAGNGAPHKRDRILFGALRLDDPEPFRRAARWVRDYAWDVGQLFGAAGQDGPLVDAKAGRRERIGRELAAAEGKGIREIPGEGHRLTGCQSAGAAGELADNGMQRRPVALSESCGGLVSGGRVEAAEAPAGCGGDGSMADHQRDGWEGRLSGRACQEWQVVSGSAGRSRPAGYAGLPDPYHSGWDNADWLYCRDERFRPVESGTFPLANGIPGRVGLLKGYGNAIVPQVAAGFVRALILSADEIGRGDI